MFANNYSFIDIAAFFVYIQHILINTQITVNTTLPRNKHVSDSRGKRRASFVIKQNRTEYFNTTLLALLHESLFTVQLFLLQTILFAFLYITEWRTKQLFVLFHEGIKKEYNFIKKKKKTPFSAFPCRTTGCILSL